MTRYDPFAYGQVPLNSKEPAAPDDVLFADAQPVKQAPAAESDWSLPEGNFGSAFGSQAPPASTEDAMAFGTDILGEKVPEAATPRRAPAGSPGGAAPARVAGKKEPAGPVPMAASGAAPARMQPAAPASAPAEGAPAANKPSVRRGPVPVLMPRAASTAGLVVSVSVVAVGGVASAWLYLMQDNPVMAAIVGVTSLVGGALAWVMMRS
jgi:hypothetical protein